VGPALAGPVEDAEARLRLGDVGGALETVRAHVASVPGDLSAHELLIDIVVTTGDGSSVVQHYRSRTEDRPEEADAWYLLGRAEPSPQDSRLAFEKALSIDPGHARAWMGVGAVRRGFGAAADATDAYEKAVALDASLAEAWNGLLALELQAGDQHGAREVALRATEAVPQDPEAWLALGVLEPGRSVAHLEKAAALVPEEHRVWLALARARFDAESWTDAKVAYGRALEILPIDGAARAELGMVGEIILGRLDGQGAKTLLDIRQAKPGVARVKLDKVVASHPGSGWAHLVRGNVAHTAGDVATAEADLSSAHKILDPSPEAAAAYGLFLLGEKRHREARSLLAGATAARPWSDGLAVAAALARAGMDERDEAIVELEAVAVRFPRQPAPATALARLLLESQRPGEAVDALARALMANPRLALLNTLVAVAQQTGMEARAKGHLQALHEATGDRRFDDAAKALDS
jgi:tetratricopeptide (TPR) repeat protein